MSHNLCPKKRQVLAQGVSAVQKRNGSEPQGLIFPRTFAPNPSMQILFSFLTHHCCIPTEKHCPLPPALPYHSRDLPSPSPGHCMAEEGRRGRPSAPQSPTHLVLTSSFSIVGGSRKPCKLGLHSAVQLDVLLRCGISPVHPGCFTASEAGVRREVCECELHPHFCSVLLHFPLPLMNSSEKIVNEIAVVKHLHPLQNCKQTT